jgi:hypothetical protein
VSTPKYSCRRSNYSHPLRNLSCFSVATALLYSQLPTQNSNSLSWDNLSSKIFWRWRQYVPRKWWYPPTSTRHHNTIHIWIDHSKTTWVHFLRELSFGCHGNHQCIISHLNHISPSLYCAWASLYIICFPAKRHESWTHVIFILGFSFGFDHKETTESQATQTGHPSSDKRHITTWVIQYYVGTCKNNTSPKITLAYNSRRITRQWTVTFKKLDTCQLFLGKK